MTEILATLEYVGIDPYRNIHFYVKKHRWRSIEKVLDALKPIEGKEVQIIIRQRE